jgi:hypothetical protein
MGFQPRPCEGKIKGAKTQLSQPTHDEWRPFPDLLQKLEFPALLSARTLEVTAMTASAHSCENREHINILEDRKET